MIKAGQIVLTAAITACCVSSAFSADQALVVASLDDINGKILINKGKGFVSAQPGMEVRPGDRVIALDNASAKLVYKNGCVTNLKENSLLAMDGTGCSNKPVYSRANDIKLAVAIGAETVDTGSRNIPKSTTPVPLAGVTPGMAVATAGLVGGVLVVRSAASNDNKPISGQ